MGFNTALIVDDSKLARVALKRKLEQRGLQIVMAEDARQALDLLQSTPIDIVFMDHLMPEMDGFQATQEIKANTATAHLPVIMCSGKEKQGYLEEARAIGASNVLPKPAETAAIEAVFAGLEQVEPGAPDMPEATSVAVSGPHSEVEQTRLMQQLVERIEALAVQFDALALHSAERFATVADTIQSLSEREASAPAVDIESFHAAWDAKLEQRIGGLALPDAELLQTQLEQSLHSSLETQLEKWQGQAEERIKQSLSEAVMQASLQRDEKMDRALEQHMATLQAEQERRVGEASDAASDSALDLEALKSSLKAELVEELSSRLPEPVPAIDAKALADSLKAEVVEQLKAEMPQPAELDEAALRESLKAEMLEQLESARQPETQASPELDIAALRQSIVAGVLDQLASKSPAGMAGLAEANGASAECSDEAAIEDELERDDGSAVNNVMASPTRQLQQEFKVLKMLGLITSLVAATSIALHWL